ncbi:DUF6504 family protein [Frondihabitans sp. PAMC 28766]|uniref:DUF6504 family protein n=1 Tax=Frondihabitans sp. PAMC 28766 TaxID=1795630 RepID=UPI0009EAAD3F|nr:DUF6504 family protein [Frondihabitans sp. PAMC 28766]
MTRVDESVTVWVSDDGVPQRIVWRARRYRVSDVPTRLQPTFPGWQTETAFDPAITHPPEPRESWRFQATGDGGETFVFDVGLDPYSARWRLLRTYA